MRSAALVLAGILLISQVTVGRALERLGVVKS